jgi:hypothetical protein
MSFSSPFFFDSLPVRDSLVPEKVMGFGAEETACAYRHFAGTP